MRNYKRWSLIGLTLAVMVSGVLGATIYLKRNKAAKTSRPRPVAEGEPRLVVQLGHSGSISSAAYSPDGRFIVSGGIDDRVAILWEAATGREIRRFPGHANQINSVAFSPDSNFVLTGSGGGNFGEQETEIKDHTARVWDTTNGKEVRILKGHDGAVNSVGFSPDGQYILTGSDDKTARVWDAASGKEIKSLYHSAPVISVAFSPDNRWVLTGSGNMLYFGIDEKAENCAATLWEISSWKSIRTFGEHKRPVGSVSFSSDSQFALLGAVTPDRDNELPDDERIKLNVSQWDIATGRKVRDYRGFGPASFSPDSRFVVTAGGGDDSTGAQVWDAKTGNGLYLISGNKDNVNEVGGVVQAVAVSPDSSTILIGFDSIKSSGNFVAESGQKAVYVFTADSGQKKLSLVGDTRKHSITELIVGVNFITEADRFIQIGGDVWDKSNGARISLQGVTQDTELEQPQVLSKDGSLVLSGMSNPNRAEGQSTVPRIAVWETATGKSVSMFPGYPYGAWITPNNKYVLFESIESSQDRDGFVLSLFDVRTGKLKWEYYLPIVTYGMNSRYLSQERTYGTLSPNGRFVFASLPEQDRQTTDPVTDEVTESQVNELLVIEVESGNVVQRIETAEQGGLQGTHVSPDGRFIILDGNIVYDLNAGKSVDQSSPSYGDWDDAAFSPDNKLIATQSFGGTDPEVFSIKVRSVDTGKIIKELPVKLGTAANLAFSPDSSKLLVSYGTLDYHNAAELFDIATGKEISKFEHYDVITSSAFSQDGRFVITSSEDGSSRIWSSTSGKEVCRLSSFKNGDWVVSTPDGRFDTNNLENIEGLYWVVSSEPLRLLPLEIFMRQYYEPRLLARVLADEQFKSLPSLAELNRTQPEVKIVAIASDSPDTVHVTVEVANARSAGQKDASGNPIESGVFDVRLFRNGQLVSYAPTDRRAAEPDSIWTSIHSWLTSPPAKDGENDGEVELDKDGNATLRFPKIKLPRTGVEQVEFSAYAFNTDRVKSATDRQTYTIAPKPTPVKGRAYIISLGINAYEREGLNLRYAANDAHQVQGNLVDRLRSRGEYEEVIGVRLVSDYEVTLAEGRAVMAQEASLPQVREGNKRVTGNHATKAHIQTVLDVLAGRQPATDLLKAVPNADKLRAARPEDLVLISVSSHGYTDGDGVFYIVASDTGTAAISSPEFLRRCVSSDELSLWLRDVDAGEMVMVIDACHSAAAVEGTGFKPGPMGSRGLGQLSYDKGMRILTATQTDNIALEANKVRQGLLIYALLQDGLSSWLADYKPRDKSIMLSEWLSYSVERVPRLYEELKDGRVRGIRETTDPLESRDDKVQQPSLFDFARRRREVILAHQP